MPKFRIQTPQGERDIGPGEPVFVIAELSGNHNQHYETAVRMIDAAVDAGVDAIKLQTFNPDTITIDSDAPWFQVKVNDAWAGQTLHSLYRKVHTPWEWQAKLKAQAASRGVTLFSTPFDEAAVDFLDEMGVALYKIASFETGDLELLAAVGRKKKPVIMSRGLTSLEDIAIAKKTLMDAGAPAVSILHCVSSYPATADQMNLAVIPDIAKRFDAVAGLSDHTLGTTVAIASVALGACIIEKHFTLRRADGGPDAAFSLEPDEMKHLVQSVRDTQAAIGRVTYENGEKEQENLVFRRSLFIVKDVKRGEPLTRENVRCIRPGNGLAPKHLLQILGKKALRDLERGTPLRLDVIEQ